MIERFRYKGLKRLFQESDAQGISPNLVEKLENILFMLNRVRRPEDMNLPGFKLHRLKGNLKGFWSVTVRANRRVIFRFERGDAYDVDLIDYH
jgi:proteic killer suppression protein